MSPAHNHPVAAVLPLLLSYDVGMAEAGAGKMSGDGSWRQKQGECPTWKVQGLITISCTSKAQMLSEIFISYVHAMSSSSLSDTSSVIRTCKELLDNA